MIAAVAGGKLAAAISGVSEFKQYVDTGRLRLLAVTSDARLAGVDVPTLKESGVNVVIGNWRGLVGPPGMSPAAARAMVAMLDKMHADQGLAGDAQEAGLGRRLPLRRRLRRLPQGRERADRPGAQGRRSRQVAGPPARVRARRSAASADR